MTKTKPMMSVPDHNGTQGRLDDVEARLKIVEDRLGLSEPRIASARDEGDRAPDWFYQNDGFLPPMPTDNGQLHFLTMAGIGDTAWVWSKIWKLAETRDVTMWFPDDDVKRVRPYANMVGMKHGFCRIDGTKALECPGEFSEEDLKDGGIFYLHANLHVESGRRIEEWMPWLPFRNPAPHHLGRWSPDTNRPYLVTHMGHFGYNGTNWPPRLWAKAVRQIQDYLPVMPMGAFWDKAYMEKVSENVEFKKLPCIDRSLEEALRFILKSSGMIAVDSGLAILAKYLGVPVLQAYPEWLCCPIPTKRNPMGTHMPGAWETDTHELSTWCYLEDLLDKDADVNYKSWLEKLLP